MQSVNAGFEVGDLVYLGQGNRRPGKVVAPEHSNSKSGVWVWPDDTNYPSCYAHCNVKPLRVYKWKSKKV